MKIPNGDAAIIPIEKIRDYLLSPTHPVGRYKAAVFRQLGFEQSQHERFEVALRKQLQQDAAGPEVTEHGAKYVSRGRIEGPNGASAVIVAVWIILAGTKVPRLVTAYPED